MWIFTPGGLLMPSVIPAADAKVQADPKLTDNGRLELQVRARVESHLTNFIRDYMDPMGLEFSDIEATPQMDYNFRFYTTKADFATAMQAAIMDIDYLKFKPTAETKDRTGKPLYADGKLYHDVLNGIWGTLLRLGRPGGTWGPYSDTNPTGYRPAAKAARGWYEGGGGTLTEGRIGTSFFRDEELAEYTDDWTPSKVEEQEELLEELDGIPVDQWEEYLMEDEFKIMQPLMEDARRRERALAKLDRRFSKRRNRRR